MVNGARRHGRIGMGLLGGMLPAAPAVWAADPAVPHPVVGSGDLGAVAQVLGSLLLVLLLIAAAAWLLRRLSGLRLAEGPLVKVLGGVAVGTRERVLLVQVGEARLVIGVAPGQVRMLHLLSDAAPPAAPAAAGGGDEGEARCD